MFKEIGKMLGDLQTENDQLKETNEGLLSIQYKLANNNKQLRQTLAKHKQVIEKVREACGMTLCGDDTRSLILEICDEVDGELDQQTVM